MTNMQRQLSDSTKNKHPKYKRCRNNLDINARMTKRNQKETVNRNL